MSRSYKKYPSGKCERSCKYGQRLANKRIRKTLENIPKGNYYKRYYSSWNICDYKFVHFGNDIDEHYKKYKRK